MSDKQFIDTLKELLREERDERKKAREDLLEMTESLVETIQTNKQTINNLVNELVSLKGGLFNKYKPYSQLFVFGIFCLIFYFAVKFTPFCQFTVPILDIEVTKECNYQNSLDSI